MPKWVEIAVSIPEEWIESTSYALMETGATGVSIEAPGLMRRLSTAEPEIRPGILPDMNALAVVKAYFPRGTEKEKLQHLTELVDKMKLPVLRVETREMDEKDWQDAWKTYYKTIKIGKNLVIKPIWEEYSSREDDIVIKMDPGQAFGTGTHPTTAMCLEMVEQYVNNGDTVVDVGTGSGILAVTAALLGAEKVLALDTDPVAVQMAGENVRQNGVSSVVEVREGNLLHNVKGPFDVVVANILSSVIIELAPAAVKVLKAGGCFIASGIIKERLPEVLAVLEREKFIVKELREQGEWVALLAAIK
jgi:ribosomal protein L11 methyltransferase